MHPEQQKRMKDGCQCLLAICNIVVFFAIYFLLFYPEELQITDEWYSLRPWWWAYIIASIVYLLLMCCLCGLALSAANRMARGGTGGAGTLMALTCVMIFVGLIAAVIWTIFSVLLILYGFKDYKVNDLVDDWQDNIIKDAPGLYCEFQADYACSGWITACVAGCPGCRGIDPRLLTRACGPAMIDDINSKWKRVGILGIIALILSFLNLCVQLVNAWQTFQGQRRQPRDQYVTPHHGHHPGHPVAGVPLGMTGGSFPPARMDQYYAGAAQYAQPDMYGDPSYGYPTQPIPPGYGYAY
eukprot:TRINITY_DN67397_c5_g8_i1.p1 TRINITY_DN67397_c5_g8~~TRINITY_DN67397_c5_g8_i1.p1  ORF type:complete len:298 (+),score=22.10 TRINITY_DN67397_c5_g8_i1:70-963(+)